MWKVRELADKVTNVVMNYTEIESRVREATNDDPWGPTGTIKHELSQATYSYDQFPEVMGMLWKRIAENKRNPRRIYKSLLVLHHLLLHGSDRVVRAAQDRLYEVRCLQDYHVVYDPGFNLEAIIGVEPTKDAEQNVRVKAKELIDLIQDEERLRDERKKAKKNRDKYVGIGSDRMMTKWDNGDYGGGYEDDFTQKKNRSRSPSPTSGRKPYRDEDSDFRKSASSNSFNNNSSSVTKGKPRPPSPGFEASDDFDPRAEEKGNDFGDFASAVTTKPTKLVTAAPTFPSLKVASTTEPAGDFADFQSAFGDSTTKSEAQKPKTDDLLGISLDLGGMVPAQPGINNASLLTNDLFSNATTTEGLGFASFPPAATTTIPSSMSSPVRGPPFSPGFSQPMASPNSGMSFGGGNDLLTPVLEPAKPSTNSNSTNVNNNNNSNKTLKGTTWSDLNLSLDDINLGRNNGRNVPTKTPMNQLKSPTNSNPNNFGGLL